MKVIFVVLFNGNKIATCFELNCNKKQINYLFKNLSQRQTKELVDKLIKDKYIHYTLKFYTQSDKNYLLHVMRNEFDNSTQFILKNFTNKHMTLEVKINGRVHYIEEKSIS